MSNTPGTNLLLQDATAVLEDRINRTNPSDNASAEGLHYGAKAALHMVETFGYDLELLKSRLMTAYTEAREACLTCESVHNRNVLRGSMNSYSTALNALRR